VIYAFQDLAVGKQLKAAAKEGAREALIVGPDELARGHVLARNLTSGEERELALTDLEGERNQDHG
jgi:histidyl-tRNA synthetase